MKRIYTAHDLWGLAMIRAELEHAGIAYLVRNEYLMGATGELPQSSCWPEIWVYDDVDHARGLHVVSHALECPNERRPWSCPHCREPLEGQFLVCWRCGALRPAASGSSV